MIAFDTNVLIYACDQQDPARRTRAIDVFQRTSDGVILWQVACEFIAASRKLESQGLAIEQAWDHLGRFLRAYPLSLPTASVLERARALHVKRQWSFWDATIVAACLESGVTRLYSEDLLGSGPPDGLEIVNPFL